MVTIHTNTPIFLKIVTLLLHARGFVQSPLSEKFMEFNAANIFLFCQIKVKVDYDHRRLKRFDRYNMSLSNFLGATEVVKFVGNL